MTMVPRRYQMEVLEKALQENIIVCLGTGTGKTLIAILLIQSFEEKLSIASEKRIAVFLAPTVPLVIQQARAISNFTKLRVGDYYGDKGVDFWSIKQWQDEVAAHQVLVMTPQVFLDALGTSALKLDFVEVLVIDECHHAHKNHPYALIMKTHYHVPRLINKPKIFGMTASPVIKKGVSSKNDCAGKLTELERILDAKVYTVEDKVEIDEYYPSPEHFIEYYERPEQDFRDMKNYLINLKTRVRREALNRAWDIQKEIKVEKSLNKLEASINHCLSDLGILPAHLALKVLLDANKSKSHSKWKPEMSKEEQEARSSIKEQFLRGVYEMAIFSQVSKWSCATMQEITSRTVNPKVLVLLKLLEKLRDIDNMRCIVFVERVIVAMTLAKLISEFPFLSHVRCEYVTGLRDSETRNATQQQKVLDDFANGKLNLLFATSVAEEGLDVQTCCAVIRFDLCQTLRSHIQSRGRARSLQSSNYVWLLERGNVEQNNLVSKLRESEKVVESEVLVRSNLDIPRMAPPEGDLEFLRVESGACKSTQDSVSFIHQYCARLGDRYYNAKPKFSFRDCFICIVEFPPNAPLRSVEGPLRRTEELAKKAACLQACRKLYEIGAVRPDTLCPDVDDKEDDKEEQEEQSMRKTESGKLRELFAAAKPSIFEGKWLCESLVQLQFYMLCFVIEPPEPQTYLNFGLLVKNVIDEEVADSEVNLFSKSLAIKARLRHVGPIQMDDTKVNAAKDYQEFLLNAAFNRLSRCWKSAQGIVWDRAQAFLLLPVKDGQDAIDWGSVFTVAEVHKTLRTPLATFRDEAKERSDGMELDMVRFANGYVHSSDIEDMVVVTVHNGRLYCVTGKYENLNGASLLPKENFTYIHYYQNRYARTLQHPEQLLLKAKAMRAFHSLLRHEKQEDNQGGGGDKTFVELPPELCVQLAIKSGLLRSLYFVPSFLHRLASLACAKQLCSLKCWPQISSTKILEALTSKKCHEDFSYESLELLGDSFMKYIVTKRLFLVYDTKHEGQLSARRSRATCNETLYRLAKSSGIAEYIRDQEFKTSNWMGPGLLTSDVSSQDSDSTSGIRRKTLADVVEALIGAYLVTSGPRSAVEFMKLIGIDIDLDSRLLSSPPRSSLPAESLQQLQGVVTSLERKLQYSFQNKSLLVEAITHASTPNCVLCYQRLEFLGDGVLDFLVSKYLYDAHPGLSPGQLTDLRSAAVNNDWFARLVVKHELHRYLRHGSEELDADIRQFVQHVSENPDASCFEDLNAPKALGDLLESLAGAIFVDTNFNLEKLWTVMLPFLSPLVTPATLRFHPVRQLFELCPKAKFHPAESATIAVTVTRGEQSLVETSDKKPKKAAKRDVARKMLAILST